MTGERARRRQGGRGKRARRSRRQDADGGRSLLERGVLVRGQRVLLPLQPGLTPVAPVAKGQDGDGATALSSRPVLWASCDSIRFDDSIRLFAARCSAPSLAPRSLFSRGSTKIHQGIEIRVGSVRRISGSQAAEGKYLVVLGLGVSACPHTCTARPLDGLPPLSLQLPIFCVAPRP